MRLIFFYGEQEKIAALEVTTLPLWQHGYFDGEGTVTGLFPASA